MAVADWTVEELSALTKGLVKFPVGTPKRWFCIAQLVGTKKEKDVIQKSKELTEGDGLKAVGVKLNQSALHHLLHEGSSVYKAMDTQPDQRDINDTRITTENNQERNNNTCQISSSSSSSKQTTTTTTTTWSPADQKVRLQQ